MTTPAAVPAALPPELAWPRPAPDRLPAAAWALALASVAAQVVAVADRGVKTDDPVPVLVSMLLGALLVRWFAAGVLSARTGRLVVTWLVLVITAVVEAVTVLDGGLGGVAGMPLLHLLTTLAMIGALMWFSTTPYYDWQRTRPRVPGPSRAGVLALAVLVGLSAGLVQSDVDAPLRIQVG